LQDSAHNLETKAGVGGSKEKLVVLKLNHKIALVSAGMAWLGLN
jgi:hypothetical protein